MWVEIANLDMGLLDTPLLRQTPLTAERAVLDAQHVVILDVGARQSRAELERGMSPARALSGLGDFVSGVHLRSWMGATIVVWKFQSHSQQSALYTKTRR